MNEVETTLHELVWDRDGMGSCAGPEEERQPSTHLLSDLCVSDLSEQWCLACFTAYPPRSKSSPGSEVLSFSCVASIKADHGVVAVEGSMETSKDIFYHPLGGRRQRESIGTFKLVLDNIEPELEVMSSEPYQLLAQSLRVNWSSCSLTRPDDSLLHESEAFSFCSDPRRRGW
jgi:hypothetical protein